MMTINQVKENATHSIGAYFHAFVRQPFCIVWLPLGEVGHLENKKRTHFENIFCILKQHIIRSY